MYLLIFSIIGYLTIIYFIVTSCNKARFEEELSKEYSQKTANAEDYEYYGLFITKKDTHRLNEWLWNNGYDWDNDIMKAANNSKIEYHCTLLHKSQENDNIELEQLLNTVYAKQLYSNSNHFEILRIDAIGHNDKALAFRVKPIYISKHIENIPTKLVDLCANTTPHITICTFGDGKPKDSNTITEWTTIDPIVVMGELRRV